jgi:protein-S-isoprenylcysteine O-methyltransferase Ste14
MEGEGASRSSTLFLAIRATVYATAFVALFVWLAIQVRKLDPRLGFELPSWVSPLGWVLLVIGVPLGLNCIVRFVREGRGTPALFDAPREFVASGPYRYVRNPMYVGGVSALLGSGLALRSPAIVLFALAAWALTHALVCFHEEPRLEKLFGESYAAYRRSVNRWIPRTSSRRGTAGARN